MTSSSPTSPAARRGTDHDLLEAVATSIGAVVRAALDDDRDAARLVLRAGARRASLVTAAEDRARRAVVGSADRRRAAQRLLLVADVARASRLVDDLARLVLTGRCERGVGVAHAEALLLLARFGEERLLQLADGPAAPGLDRAFARCGRCLLEAAERLDVRRPGGRTDDVVVTCCALLAGTVLQASRHALRAVA